MSSVNYDHSEIEKKWQNWWEKNEVYKTPEIADNSKKKYILDAFAYPSGSGLHAGHAEGYVGTDILARYWRMKGKNVLYPVGWDAFGLPAENYAVKTGIHPRINTDQTIEMFQKQVRSLGLSNDWTDEIASHEPEYYKWTQWFFTMLYKLGLAYKKEALVNWDPVDQTVLANEQVLSDGTAERSGAVVEQRMMSQWFFKITDYIEDSVVKEGVNAGQVRKGLLNGLDNLDWPESTKQMQRNWIGRSEGAIVRWSLADQEIPLFDDGNSGIIDMTITPRERGCAIIRIKGTKKFVVFTKTKEKYASPHAQKDWVYLPGGMIEEGENAYQSTIRETEEEIGITGLEYVKPLGSARKFVEYDSGIRHYLEHCFLFEIEEKDFTNRKQAEVDAQDGTWAGEVILVDEARMRANGWDQLNYYLDNLHTKNQFEVETFTTRVDTIYGATYLVLAPEHHLVDRLTTEENAQNVAEYQEKTRQKSQLQRTDLNKEKSGVFTGGYVIHPLTGEKIPVFIADYVLSTYGTGAIMAVPAHDQRDYEFAQMVNNDSDSIISLDIPAVVAPLFVDTVSPLLVEDGILINSGEFNGIKSEEARTAIARKLQLQGQGRLEITYRLRDWLVSRQRYWGSPIPVAYDTEGNERLVEDKDLPIILPDDVEFKPTGQSPLLDHEGFHKQAEQLFGAGSRMESDTMDTFVCSSWYFFRFCDPRNTEVFANPEKLKNWLPIDKYVIGAEHTVLHLLYARFFTKVLFDLGYIDFDEPFTSLRHPGLILAEDGRKMSKRWGNVVNPLDVIEEYGADTLRIYEMFMGPFEQSKPWNTSTIKGVRRFLDRVWKFQNYVVNSSENPIIAEGLGPKGEHGIEVALNKLIKKIGDDIPSLSFNTSVAEFMKFANTLEEVGGITYSQWKRFLLTLAPFAPYITEELWQISHGRNPEIIAVHDSIHKQTFPEYIDSYLIDDEIILGIQVNGKVRSEIAFAPDEAEESVKAKVLADDKIQKWLEGKEIKKFIYIPGKIVSVVV